ncbi:MAG: 30S ribosomal protein S20 [candidate division Zixibacteria bacterium]|nr:30S ribosomal protein S20 [candidate division Zixibacteria bacterium]
MLIVQRLVRFKGNLHPSAALDRAAGKSLIHKNMAARKKSRLYAQVARLKN